MSFNLLEVEAIIRRSLAEDIGTGDITTTLTIPYDSVSRARIVSREDGIIAGLEVAALTLSVAESSYPLIDEELDVTFLAEDGAAVKPGDVVLGIKGSTSAILTGERVALNFIQRMSGIATMTARLVDLIKHTGATIADTRKTTPGLRILEKYAVRAGGGRNHRFGLYDAVLIKDNHIKAVGGIRQAIGAARSGAPHTVKIEVETDTIEQVKEALDAGADLILLDNMAVPVLREAVSLCKGRAVTEASGGITEESIVSVAETGVDIISVGALTHSVKALDLSLEII